MPYIKPTERQIKAGLEWGWSLDACKRGYDIFNFDGTGMLEIEAIADVYLVEDEDCSGYDDEACAIEAERSGFCKIIPVNELPEDFGYKYFGWIDTPENRQAIYNYCNR